MPIECKLRVKTVWFMAVLIVFCLFLTGCSSRMRTAYQRPRLDLPGHWSSTPQDQVQDRIPDPSGWWQVFEDPLLDRLIGRVLKTNTDLAAAAIKMKKARMTAGLEALNTTPDFSAGASAGQTKTFKTGTSSKSFGTSMGLSWEVDLWGKLAASRDAARWEAEATEQDLAATALSLVGTTADLYWQIAYLNQAIETSQKSIAYTQKTLEVVNVKYAAGQVSNLDVLQAKQDVASRQADLEDLNQQMAEAKNALAVLFRPAPGPVMANPGQLSDMPLPMPVPGIPADVLANRPDLRAAELRLRATLADADATRASYYPGLSLTSDLGTSSVHLIRFLSDPVGSLGAGLTLPFVQWHTMKLNVKIAEQDYAQAVAEFRTTLYDALKDVENALSARAHYLARADALGRSFDLAKAAEQVAEVRYRAGKTGVQTWLDQQETRRTAELAVAKNRYSQLTNMMTLYQALGGVSCPPVHRAPSQ